MTAVNVTTDGKTTVVQDAVTSVVSVTTAGPQGAKGIELDETAKVNGSVVYYDSAAGKFKADTTWTTSTLVTGGDF